MFFKTVAFFMILSILGLLYMLYAAFIKKTRRYSVIYSVISIIGLQMGMLALFFMFLIYFTDTQKEFVGTGSRILIQLYASSI